MPEDHVELLFIAFVAVVTLGSAVVTLSWAVPAATEFYFGRKLPR